MLGTCFVVGLLGNTWFSNIDERLCEATKRNLDACIANHRQQTDVKYIFNHFILKSKDWLQIKVLSSPLLVISHKLYSVGFPHNDLTKRPMQRVTYSLPCFAGVQQDPDYTQFLAGHVFPTDKGC